MPKFVCNHSRTFRRRRSEASKQTIDILKDRHIGNGFKVDEAAADRVLAYLRQLAAGKPEDDDEWAEVVKFCWTHGISLDWIVCGDPVNMISGTGAMALFGGADYLKQTADKLEALVEIFRAAQLRILLSVAAASA